LERGIDKRAEWVRGVREGRESLEREEHIPVNNQYTGDHEDKTATSAMREDLETRDGKEAGRARHSALRNKIL